ncbi:MAG: type II toxin-antitoxin system HicA family toxin [Dehalococcoidia bacterium]
MRLPRSISGTELAALLRRSYGYSVTRQTGSHMRLTSTYRGYEHHITIPRHNPLRIGTLSSILGDVASYLEIDREQLALELFSR